MTPQEQAYANSEVVREVARFLSKYIADGNAKNMDGKRRKSERDVKIFKARFGLEDGIQRNWAELSREFGVSSSRIIYIVREVTRAMNREFYGRKDDFV